MTKQSRSVGVDFGVVVDSDDNTEYRIVSVDAVPAFVKGDNYEIPNIATGKWMGTNPEIHAAKAVAAHQAYGNEWKGSCAWLNTGTRIRATEKGPSSHPS